MPLEAPQAQLPDSSGDGFHYLRALTALGDYTGVVAAADIYADDGSRLIAKGARIGSGQFGLLSGRRLMTQLDHNLIVDNAVDGAKLTHLAGKVIESNAIYRRLIARAGDPMALKHALSGLKLSGPLQVRLTVMRARRTELFEHCLRVAMIAFALAQQLKLPPQVHAAALLAGLFHDAGEMHTDPAVLAVEHRITPDERHFIYSHPLTSHAMAIELTGFPAAAAQAILQHHERLDGSGYPGKLTGERIAPLAKLIAVADVAESIIKRFDPPRLDMLLRLNLSRFDATLVGALRDLLHATPGDAHNRPSELGAAAQLDHLAELLRAWFTLRPTLEEQRQPGRPDGSPLAFLFERMGTIRSLVLQAGFDPDNMAGMLTVAREDPAILLEVRGMLDEMDWLLRDLAHEIERRAPELAGLSQGALKEMLDLLQPLEAV